MKVHPLEIKNKAKSLRSQGKTYQDIINELDLRIPKSTLSYWLRGVILSPESERVLSIKINEKLKYARSLAINTKKQRQRDYLNLLDKTNLPISENICNIDSAKIALAMLCLGEASKSTSKSGFYLGSSDKKIIILFINLLRRCFSINSSKFRFTIQCRADQKVELLEEYWREVVGVSTGQFYKPRADPRSVGKPTLKKDYMGVLRVDYIDRKIQLELESLAKMLYNQVLYWK